MSQPRIIKCPTCGVSTDHKVMEPDGKTITPYWICGYCDLWFQYPMPPKVYEADHEKGPNGEFVGHLMSDQEKGANRDIAQGLFHTWMGGAPGKTLDIGAKYPYLASCFKEFGCESYAMDNIEIVPEYSKQLDVPMLMADFELITEKQIQDWTKTEKFKIITMIHTFEHMYDPLEALRKLRRLVDDDGYVFFRLPNHSVTGYERDLTPGHYTIHPYYHSLSSILALLAKGQDLFTIEQIYNSVGFGQSDLVLKPLHKKPTLYCGMIVKNEERDLPRCLKSVAPIVDKFVIIDTGSTDNTEWAARNALKKPGMRADIKSTNLIYRTYTDASKQDESGDWKLWDFGKARNEYVRLIEEDTNADYLIWMDADDELLTPDHLQRALYCNFIDAFGVQIQTSGQRWIHCRVWKTKRGVTFGGKIHEYPILDGLNYVDLLDSVVEHHPEPHEGVEDSNKRNLRILEAEYNERPNDTRLAFYLGNTHKDAARYDQAIPYYEKRVELGDAFRDEWLFAFLYLARCQRAAGKHEDARKTLFKAIGEAPTWSEFWMELSYMAYNITNWEEAIGFAFIALSNEISPTQLWREKDKYADQPLRMVSWAYEEMGNYSEALLYARRAKEEIGQEDAEWETRINRLETLAGSILDRKSKEQRIALHRPGAIGDIIMTLNLVPELQKKWPNHAIDYYCNAQIGNQLKELMVFAGIAEVVDNNLLEERKDRYDKVFNLIGYPLHEGYPKVPMKKHLIQYFAEELGLEEKLWSLALGTPKIGLPDLPKEYATIQPIAGWSTYKNWPVERWEEVVKQCPDIPIIQIGSANDPKIPGCIHTYMGTQLMLGISLIANAKMHLGVDSFGNHITNYWWQDEPNKPLRKVPAVILWGSTQYNASGYPNNINISTGIPCQPCFKEDPALSSMSMGPCLNPPDQSYENPKHRCMYEIDTAFVLEQVRTLWSNVTTPELPE